MIFKMAFRNIFRQKRRSFLTALGMIMGMVLMSVSMSISKGSYDMILNTFTSNHSGHLQIHYKDYLDTPSLYKSLKAPSQIEKTLSEVKGIKSFAPRVYSGSLAFFSKKSTGVSIKGIDPVKENSTTDLKRKFENEVYFSSSNERAIIVSLKLKKILNLDIGSNLVLITQGADGSIANDLFPIKGFVDSEEQGMEPNIIFMPLVTLQEFLSLGSRVHEYAILIDSFQNSRKMSHVLREQFSNKDLDIQPWQVILKDFYKAMQADLKGNQLSLGILIFIVSLGILNTILMSVLERTREFGVLKAIGTSPYFLFRLIVLENSILSLISLGFGFLIALGVNYSLTVNGIQLEQPVSYGGLEFEIMNGSISPVVFMTPMAVVFMATVAVSLWPGIRAARISPVKAMSSH